MDTLIRLENVTKDYGRLRALDGVSLTVQRGATGLLGPNGAGKSTLIKLLLGLVKSSGGSGEVLGFRLGRDARLIRGACRSHARRRLPPAGPEPAEGEPLLSLELFPVTSRPSSNWEYTKGGPMMRSVFNPAAAVILTLSLVVAGCESEQPAADSPAMPTGEHFEGDGHDHSADTDEQAGHDHADHDHD